MTSYSPVGQLTGTFAKSIDLGDKVPWLYAIASLSGRLVYVGEAFQEGGLLRELGLQLGSDQASTMLAQAAELGVGRPLPPHVVVAARLPSEADPAEFDGASAIVRSQCLATLQAKVAERFVPANPGWTDISIAGAQAAKPGSAVDAACEAIFDHLRHAISSMVAMSRSIPMHVLLLDPYPVAAHESDSIDAALADIELLLHDWLIGSLRTTFGADWWKSGVPLEVRKGCASRREDDGGDHSVDVDAYLMFIDLIAIAKGNWQLAGPLMERVAGRNGKEQGTSWIGELNQLRKLSAHPVRGKYVKAPVGSRERVIDLRRRLNEAIAALSMKAREPAPAVATDSPDD